MTAEEIAVIVPIADAVIEDDEMELWSGSYSAGVSAGGSQGPVVNSCWRAWSLSMPHLVAVSR